MIRAFFFSILLVAVGFVALPSQRMASASVSADTPAWCNVDHVIDGGSFACQGGTTVRLLQMDAPAPNECGGDWARAALANIFLAPGTYVRFEYDTTTTDGGLTLAAPIVRGTDGSDYNISIVMVYVGLAKAGYHNGNAKYLDWANASQTWAQTAQWNMWAPGGPFNGGTNCGQVTPPTPMPTIPPPPPPPPTDTPIVSRGTCGAPANPYGFDFCGPGSYIYSPPGDICTYIACIGNFWNGRGYVIECRDGMFGKSGGISGSCSYHGGNSQPLYSH